MKRLSEYIQFVHSHNKSQDEYILSIVTKANPPPLLNFNEACFRINFVTNFTSIKFQTHDRVDSKLLV